MTTVALSKNVKRDRIIFWVSTALIVLLDAIPAALFSNSPMAIEGMHRMGFPDYFRIELSVGKTIGGLLLILPMVPARLKEWAYVGFGITFISAIIGNWVINGPLVAMQPLVGLAILIVSYIYYHKTKKD
jgi:hypothetical protein